MLKKRRPYTIKSQIQIAIITISVVSMLVLGFSIYMKATYRVEQNYEEDFSYTLKKCDNIINIQISSVIELMRGLLSDDVYISTLKNISDDGSRYLSAYQLRKLKNSVGEITLKDRYIQEAITVTMDGKFHVYSKKNDISQYLPYYREKNIVEQDWISEVVAQKGKEVVFGNNVITGKGDVISIAKSLISIEDGSQVGYIIMNVSKKIFNVAFDYRGEYETICFAIRDKKYAQQVVYSSGSASSISEVMNDNGILAYSKDNRYVICKHESYIDGWELFSAIQSSELNKQRKNLGFMIVFVVTFMVMISVAVSSRIAKRIYKPLAQLEQMILQVEEGMWDIEEEFDNNEIGMVGRKFKEMVTQTLQLREQFLFAKVKQREQELYLLQQQINPHFLYNTLDALYSMAEIQGAEEIANMVEALSKTFRLSLNKGGSIISVREEIEHIQAYMIIQNMRFNNRFSLVVNVEEEILQVKILNLILEPFVENAVCHGLEPKIGNGKVEITGKREKDGSILFVIQDDGIGVEDMGCLESGYGIANVRERISLTYGKEFGISFRSEAGKGMAVYVRISELGWKHRDEESCNY